MNEIQLVDDRMLAGSILRLAVSVLRHEYKWTASSGTHYPFASTTGQTGQLLPSTTAQPLREAHASPSIPVRMSKHMGRRAEQENAGTAA